MIDQLKKDTRVRQVWAEGEDGMWVVLQPGYADTDFDPCQPTHTIHEWTWRAVRDRMRDVEPCACAECLEVRK